MLGYKENGVHPAMSVLITAYDAPLLPENKRTRFTIVASPSFSNS